VARAETTLWNLDHTQAEVVREIRRRVSIMFIHAQQGTSKNRHERRADLN